MDETLQGVRVVTLAQNVPGPVAAARLHALGAHVLKVEPPGGDPLAGYSPSWYAQLHRGCEVVQLDLKRPGDRAALEGRLGDADVLLASNRPSALQRLGLGWVTGVQLALSDGDEVITSYRDHGHMLATGMEPRGVMAELTGRAAGYSRGKGGSMHMFSREKNFFGGHGIVGAQVSLGTGLAFSNFYRGNDRVSITYFGEGASNQGQVFESFNIAALMKLPCIYVIENNRYGMGTSVERASASRDLSKNGAPWGIPGVQVNGMDVSAVYQAAVEAVAHCRAGSGPYLMEMMTYRYRGHSMSDPAKYRTREEVQEMREHRDPIENTRRVLLEPGTAEEELKRIEAEARAAAQDAADHAQRRRSRIPANCGPTCCSRKTAHDGSADAGPVADHDRGQAGALAQTSG